MEAQWVLQLNNDYDHINWEHRTKLSRPLIRIVDVQSYFGQWDPLLREIKISKKLIVNRKWNIVLGVLKHEMSHQYVTDVFRVEDGHGDYFQKACDRFGVEAVFRKSESELDSILSEQCKNYTTIKPQETVEDAEVERIFEKVEKLLSLAQSANEHEAALAMEKVNEILEKHNLKRIDKNASNQNYSYIIIEFKKQKISAIQSLIASILIEHFFVKVVFSQQYEALLNTHLKTMEIIGANENVKMAEYVYFFLTTQADLLWRARNRHDLKDSRFKRSYQIGLLHGFRQKLIEAKEARLTAVPTESKENYTRALVQITDDPYMNEYINLRFPRLRTRNSSSGRIFGDAFSHGKSDGKSIVLNKGVTNSHKGETLRLQ